VAGVGAGLTMGIAPKVLMIGFDAAEYQLVDQWMREGELPHLKSLRKRGVLGRLQSPTGMGDDAAWASFYTAVSPAKHGRYFHHSILPGSYRLPFWNDSHLRAEPFWDTLSRRGKRIALIDVPPKSPLSASINGLQLADWRVHGRDHLPCSHPPELVHEVLARFGDDMTDRLGTEHALCGHGYRQHYDYPGFVGKLLQGLDDKLALGLELLKREPWDLFLVVFKEAHCAGHKLWHLHDAAHRSHPPQGSRSDADAMKRVYKALDSALGELLVQAGPQTSVIVFSDLGMAGNFTANHLLDRILQRLEWAQSNWLGRCQWVWNRFKQSLGTRLLGKDSTNFERRTRRYFDVIHGEQAGAVRFNVIGRDPKGLIAPGAPLQAQIEWLSAALKELEDPASGRKLVSDIVCTDQAFAGDHHDRLPDLLEVWDRCAPIFAARSPRIGTVSAPDPELRTGGHVSDGWFVAAGPGISVGDAATVSLMDLAPSVAMLLGESLGEVDGRPVPEIRP
jgi:predicted AlkP superfamily phosphohydrolase/phosphomutase